MQYSQQVLYKINLPNFLIEFKNKCNQMIVPHLIEFKNYINEEDNNATVHPVITIVTIFVVLYSIQAVFKGLFANNSSCNDSNHKNNSNQSQQLSRQLNDLKKQLKGLYVSFTQLSKQLKNKKSKPNTNTQKTSQASSIQKNQHVNENLLKLWKQFVPIYNNSIQNNKKLALYILSTQQQVFLQLKKLKKNNRLSSSSGRPSTVRSKTSDKKLFTSQISKQKKSLPQLVTLKQNIIKQQPNTIQIPVSKQSFSNNSGQSTSTLQATIIPLSNQHSDSNNSVDEAEKKVLQTPVVVKIPPMKNVKPPLPKVQRQMPAKNINIVDGNNQQTFQEQSMIKRSQKNINIISPLKIQQKQSSFENINEINNNNKAEITQRTQMVIEKNQQKTQKKTNQSPQQIKNVKQEQNLNNQSVAMNNNFMAPSFQNEEIPEFNKNEHQQHTNQPLPPPKLTNIKKLNPPSKANTGRRAPPPPPKK